jgi:oligopeptide transport system permease protein
MRARISCRFVVEDCISFLATHYCPALQIGPVPSFILSRLLQSFIVIVAVQVLTFALLHSSPGGPYATEKNIPEHIRERIKVNMGLDQPLHVQLGRHLWNQLTFADQPSLKYKGMMVNDILRQGFPVSATIGIAALCIALMIGIPAGAVSALRPFSAEDWLARGAATLGIAMPSLILGPVLALVLALKLRWFNVAGWYDADDWVLPALTLGIIYGAYITRITRAGLRETLAQDFIRTARAKGVGEAGIVMRHAAKLACLPLLNFLGPAAAGLLTGSFVVETVFQVPGLGQHFVNSATNKDFTLATTCAGFYAVLICLFNLLVDVAQAWLNPRVGFNDKS